MCFCRVPKEGDSPDHFMTLIELQIWHRLANKAEVRRAPKPYFVMAREENGDRATELFIHPWPTAKGASEEIRELFHSGTSTEKLW